MDSLLSTLTNVLFVGFVSLMAFDFASGLHKLWIKSETKDRHALPNLDAKDSVLTANLGDKPETFTTTTLEDPWIMPMGLAILTPPPCCCHSAIATPLLPPALEVAELPDIAQLDSTRLRKMCSEAGIKWRNTNGSKHLSKGEMIASLTS